MDRQLGWLESSGADKSLRTLSSLLRKSGHLSEDLLAHFQREEKALYPILEKRMGSNSETVRVMRQEHQELLDRASSVKSEISRMLNNGDSVRTWELASKLQELRGSLSDHVSREERVLFWLADLRLSPLDLRQVLFNLTQMSRISKPSLTGTTKLLGPSVNLLD
jgi:DUF438 domain-containing protein